MSARQSFIEIGTPMVSRPWEAVWGSVHSYTPRQPLASTREPPNATPAPVYAAPTSPIEDKAGELARARVRGRLETDLSRYFSYPAIARKQGWQGHVSVEFTVQPDGRLTDVRVTRSSGYHVLDQSALAALRKVGHLTEAPQWLNGQSITVELPVIYRLEN
jgi:protein TonB